MSAASVVRHPFTRRDAAWLAALVAGFVATRVAWLRWNPGSGSYWEEAYRWIAVELWRQGSAPSFIWLQADDYQGGSLLMIALAALPLRALGGSVFALKLTAVGFSTLTLVALFELLRRYFGRVAAVIAGAAYLAGPPLVAFWSLTVMGSHGESVLWSLVQIGIFLGLLSGRRPLAAWLAFGLVSGLGLWFCFTTGISLVACTITWCLLERPPRPRELAVATLGGAVGLLPWIAYNVANDFAGIERVLQLFGLAPQVDPWPAQGWLEKSSELVTHVLPTALLDPTHSAEQQGQPVAIALAFASVTLPALLLWLERVVAGLRARGEAAAPRRARARLELVFLVYPLVFLGVYLVSRYAVDVPGTLGYRIFTPFAVLMCVPVALTLAEFIAAGGISALAGLAACAAWLASLAASTVYFASREPDGNSPVTRDGGYRTLGVLLHRKHAPDVAPAVAMARALPGHRDHVLFGLGWGMQNRHEMGAPLAELEQMIATIPEPERTDVFKGIYWTVQVRRGTLIALLKHYADTPQLRGQLERVQALSDWLARTLPPG